MASSTKIDSDQLRHATYDTLFAHTTVNGQLPDTAEPK